MTFPSGSNSSSICENVTIINDNVLEGEETFSIELTSMDTAVILGNNRTVITITDNDGIALYIVCSNAIACQCIVLVVLVNLPATLNITEDSGTGVEVCVTSSPVEPTERALTVELTTNNGSAEGEL